MRVTALRLPEGALAADTGGGGGSSEPRSADADARGDADGGAVD